MNPTCPPGPSLAPPATLRILLVEDDELVRLTFTALLAAKGQPDCQAFADGQLALEAVGRGLAADLAILDYNLPGLDGLQTLARLRALIPGLPAILVTGSFNFQDTPELDAPGPLALLRKPFTLEALDAVLAEVL